MKLLADYLPKAGLSTVAVAAALAFATPSHAASCGSEYAVGSGDTLSRIASKCGVGMVDLVRANHNLSNPNRLRIGQKLAIPTAGAQGASDTVAAVDPKPSAGPRTLSGLVVSGSRCALLETDDGAIYGLTGNNKVFASGATVTVTGTMHGTDECGPQQMLVVSDLVEG